MTTADHLAPSDALADLIATALGHGWARWAATGDMTPLSAGVPARLQELRSAGDGIRVTGPRWPGWIEVVLAALSHGAVAWLGPPRCGPAAPDHPPVGPDTALVLPTLGSTGSPQHVRITRQGLADCAAMIAARYRLTGCDVAMLPTDPAFDALSAGATVAAPEQRVMMPMEFAECCRRLGVTVANLPTRYALQLSQLAPRPLAMPLPTLIVGGDRLSWDAPEAVIFTFAGVAVRNAYGLTECCVISKVHDLEDSATVYGSRPLGAPIGRPFDGVELRVVPQPGDTNADAVLGDLVVGELPVCGRRVAEGYLGLPGGTRLSSTFRHDVGGIRLATGDRVARQPSTGLYWLLGRYDNRAKARGQRVDLEYLEQRRAIIAPGWRRVANPLRSTFEEVTHIRVASDEPAHDDPGQHARIERELRERPQASGVPVEVVHVPDIVRHALRRESDAPRGVGAARSPADKYRLECLDCGWTAAPRLIYRCPSCNGALDAVLDLRGACIRESERPEAAYFDFLPIISTESIPVDGSRATTCRRADRLGTAIGLTNLWVKDESEQPSGSTKDRLATIMLAVLREFGVDEFVSASTGNTAIALARAVARDGDMRAHFYFGSEAFGGYLITGQPGCTLTTIDGSYVDAIAAAHDVSVTSGIMSDGGFFNWARREGLKVAYLEAFDSMPIAPDVVVQAISSGMGIVAANKGAAEYVALGRLAHVPRFLMVQQDSCSPMARCWRLGRQQLTDDDVVARPRGLATAILLGDARASYPYLRDLARSTDGAIVDVTQGELVEARSMLHEIESLDVCYSSAATIAAVRGAVAAGQIGSDDVVLVNLTGRYRDEPAGSREVAR